MRKEKAFRGFEKLSERGCERLRAGASERARVLRFEKRKKVSERDSEI